MTRNRKWSKVPGTTTIDYDDEEATPLCFRDLDVQTLTIEWESSGDYDPGDWMTPPWGQEERIVTSMTAVLRGGKVWPLSEAERKELEQLYWDRIEDAEFPDRDWDGP